jgi:hypothetical protein
MSSGCGERKLHVCGRDKFESEWGDLLGASIWLNIGQGARADFLRMQA